MYLNSNIEILQEIKPVFKNGKLEVEVDKNPTIFTNNGNYKLKGETRCGFYSKFKQEYVIVVDERLIISKRIENVLDPICRDELKDIKYNDTLIVAGNISRWGQKDSITVKNGLDKKYITYEKIYEKIKEREKINLELSRVGTNMSELKNNKALFDHFNKYYFKNNDNDFSLNN